MTFLVLTDTRLRLREIEWLTQHHTASSVAEPKCVWLKSPYSYLCYHINSSWRGTFVFTAEKMLCVVCMYWEKKRGWNFPSRHHSDTHVLDRRMIFLPLRHHLCVELCREEGEDSISDPYHCLRDVAFILLYLTLKGFVRKTLTITWSVQVPPHNTGSTITWTQLQYLPTHGTF